MASAAAVSAVAAAVGVAATAVASASASASSTMATATHASAGKAVALILCGALSPITNMHLRSFELARDHLRALGYSVPLGILSPVSDRYKKLGLATAAHRVNMCRAAVNYLRPEARDDEQAPGEWVRVCDWEATQTNWLPTVQVMYHYADTLKPQGLEPMLLCGADLVASFNHPGLWDPKDVRHHRASSLLACITMRAEIDAARAARGARLDLWTRGGSALWHRRRIHPL